MKSIKNVSTWLALRLTPKHATVANSMYDYFLRVFIFTSNIC